MKRYESGLTGEAIAEQYLTEKGMTCLDRRVRREDGEIDLILLDGEILVFCEVKYRPSAPRGAGLMAVDPKKQGRMYRAAVHYLAEKEYQGRPARFDVVEITRDGLLHIPDAFRAQ